MANNAAATTPTASRTPLLDAWKEMREREAGTGLCAKCPANDICSSVKTEEDARAFATLLRIVRLGIL